MCLLDDSTELFSIDPKLFARDRGFMSRPTHDQQVTLRQTGWFFPERGCEKAGRPGPPSHFFLSALTTIQSRIAIVAVRPQGDTARLR
jgi:hypothetical protein